MPLDADANDHAVPTKPLLTGASSQPARFAHTSSDAPQPDRTIYDGDVCQVRRMYCRNRPARTGHTNYFQPPTLRVRQIATAHPRLS